jgi:tolkin protein
MQEPTGSLESPFYPHSSPPSEGESCEWRITATHGERIVLNVTDLDLPASENCETDFVEIRDGYWPKSPLLGESPLSFIHPPLSCFSEIVISHKVIIFVVSRIISHVSSEMSFRETRDILHRISDNHFHPKNI